MVVPGGNTVARLIKNVHEGPVFCINVNNDGLLVSGGGKDRRLVQFDLKLQRTGAETQVQHGQTFNLVALINVGILCFNH